MNKTIRGAVDPVTLIVVAVVAMLAVPNWRPSNWFKKGPPTITLAEAQAKQAAADKAVADLQAQVAALRAADEAKKSSQLGYTHEMVAGAIESNAKAPDSTEKAITDSFLQRADIGLNAVLGKLTPEVQAEVVAIVAQLRSGDQAKIAAANAMLAEKDRELNQATADRTKLAGEKQAAEQKLNVAEADRLAKTEKVTKLTAEVVSYANKSYENEKQAGSFGAMVDKLVWILVLLVGGYIVIHVLLPLWAQSYPGIGWLQKVAAFGKNITTAHL